MEIIGKYELVREIGRGSTARVCLAREKKSKEQVSLKIFYPSLCQDSKFLKRIDREMQVSRSLKHKNIVRVRDVLSQQNPPVLVMDFVDGESLEKYQERLPYVLPEVSVMIVIEVLQALEYAHSANVVHRDLKPENILIQEDGHIFVADFGLAKLTNASLITKTTTLIGSPDYMAPEQCEGDTVDARSDVFSVAAVLYFLVTGTRPFSKSSMMATIAAIKSETPESVNRRNPKVSLELNRILSKAMSKKADERYQSAKQFREALENYLKDLGIDLATYNFKSWHEGRSAATMEILRVMSDSLVYKCEIALKSGNQEKFLENLAHLSQKAPQCAALRRLNDSYDQQNQEETKKKRIKIAAVCALLFVFLGAFIWMGRSGDENKVSTPPPVSENKKIENKKEAPPPVVETGTVKISVPKNAKVYWDGKRVDTSKPLHNQKVGNHRLVLIRPGYDPHRARIRVQANKTTVINVR